MRYRKFFARIKQRGQMLVLFALMIPIIMLFVGLAFDLGWYYLNVSRLQNAADAAALAGAQAIQDNSEDALGIQYYVDSLAGNNLPKDFDDYEKIDSQNFGTLVNYRNVNDPNDTRGRDLLMHGRNHVEEYMNKNLAKTALAVSSADNWKLAGTTDGWGLFKNEADNAVTGTIDLKYKIVDGKNDKYGQLYYVVTLTEKIRHFFLPGWFEGMNATVKAVVLLEPHDSDLLSAMWKLERTKVMDNWEYQNKYKGTDGFYYEGKWNHYQAGDGDSKIKGIKYTDDKVYRTESVTVLTQDRTQNELSSGIKTSANGRKFFSANQVDSINIDFRAEILKKFTSDWDLGQAVTGQSYEFTEGWSATNGADKRILFNAEFDEAFPTRTTDPTNNMLWVRIESDPIQDLTYIGKPNHKSYNSVRQITLNFNADNTAKSGNNYIYRPYCIFYTGPEHIDYATDSNGVLIRHSQPVVVNLNADLNAIMFFPNSPVVINGNNHDWTGFIIAKCFLASVTEEDMINGNSFMYNDGFHEPTSFRGNFTKGVDGYGNTIYVAQSNLFTREQLDLRHPQATMTSDDGGNLSVYGELPVPKYPVVSFSKSDFAACTTREDYYSATAAKLSAMYTLEKYAQFSGLYESQISAVTLPDGRMTGVFYVPTSELKETDTDPNVAEKDDKYVPVIVDGQTRYVDKTKLPYVKARRNDERVHVNIYDLKKISENEPADYNRSVRILDENIPASGSTDTSADVFIATPDNKNKYGDTWYVDKSLWDSTYKNNYTDAKLKLELGDADKLNYFMFKKDYDAAVGKTQLIAQYRKVTVDGEVKYIKSDTNFYMKVNNNANNTDNYIIVDYNGNILTKSLPNGSTRLTNPNEKPIDPLKIGDRAYEVVYVDPNDQSKPPFNLNFVEYSSFDVPELKRKIYKYLDDGGSVDMFFTTIRAGWVD
ncbi:MAG: pilus assembly protein [Selenomonadaceae bacterium]|nr:pilus assembly protein [Selenomonadaceae bacterium]